MNDKNLKGIQKNIG